MKRLGLRGGGAAWLAAELGILAVLAAMGPVAAASPPPCRVNNITGGADYAGEGIVLQIAISTAAAGDTLRIKGSCEGNYNIIGKDLTLIGMPLPRFPSPSLDGGGTGYVLTIEASTVAITGLTITNGSYAGEGGGVRNFGDLTLTRSTVRDNAAAGPGGGIYNLGDLALTDSTLSGNSARDGGGVHNGGTLSITRSIVSGNTAVLGGGGINSLGSLSLIGSLVSGNTADYRGGGIASAGSATLVGSTVTRNFATSDGGGIAKGGTLAIIDTMVTSNRAGVDGGGIGSFGGVSILSGATNIQDNFAGTAGGGIAIVGGGNVTAAGDWTGSVSDNSPDDCDPDMTLGGSICI